MIACTAAQIAVLHCVLDKNSLCQERLAKAQSMQGNT